MQTFFLLVFGRSFLRKCRRVEKINGSHSALHWDHGDLSASANSEPLDLDYIVTPREVLGFSWQIAKGMAYLSDMKVLMRFSDSLWLDVVSLTVTRVLWTVGAC